MPTETTTNTALRTWKGDKATITVTLTDGTVLTAGGTRAARAEAALVTLWSSGYHLEIRGRLQTAEAEAARNSVTRQVRSGRYGNYTQPAAVGSIAIPVTEAEVGA